MLSYPKSKIKALLLENIHPSAIGVFEKEGYQIEIASKALGEAELIKRIEDVQLLGIRSNTQVTQNVLDSAKRLQAVGAFCIGTNQIDLKASQERGIAVFNAPYANTRSVVELALGEMIALRRKMVARNNELHQGVWNKSAADSHEIRGQVLGIVGYGNIGSQLSVLAESLGMKVLFYDIQERLRLGNAESVSTLEELLEASDIVSLHVDGREENRDFFGEAQFSKMKQGAIFLNLSRGFLIDFESLSSHLESGHLLGAAIDVFPSEPKSKDEVFKNPLQGMENVILTPHVAGSTEEAQESIGSFVAEKLVSFINSGNTSLSVNMPNLVLPEQANAHRILHIHQNVPGVLAKLNGVLADHGANVIAQYLSTRDNVGYLINDINHEYDSALEAALRELPETIRLRVLY